MFNFEAIRAAMASEIQIRPLRKRWVANRVMDMRVCSYHKLPWSFPDYETALEQLSAAGLTVVTFEQ